MVIGVGLGVLKAGVSGVVNSGFAGDLSEEEGEVGEALAEGAEGGGFGLVGGVVEGGYEMVGGLALVGVVAGEVGGGVDFYGVEEGGVDAGPEEEEVADVLVDGAFSGEGCRVEADVGFGEHFEHSAEGSAFSVADGEDVFGADEGDEEPGEVGLDLGVAFGVDVAGVLFVDELLEEEVERVGGIDFVHGGVSPFLGGLVLGLADARA